MSLRLRISFYFAFLFTLLFFIIFLIIRYENIKNFKEVLENHAKTAAKSLAIGGKDFLLQERTPDLVKICYEIKGKEEDIVYTAIVDNKDIIRGAWKEDLVGKNISEISVFKKDTNFIFEGSLIFNRVFDIVYMDKIIGKAIVGISSKSSDILIREIQKRMITIFLSVLIIGFLGIFLLGGYIVSPVKKIINAIEKIGKGEFNVYIGVKRKDEIGRIAREIEKMSSELARAQKEIMEKERIKRDMEIAKEIQKALIPSFIPEIPEYEIEFFYKPAFFVSGDYIDIIKIPLDRYFIILGDVSGKGAGSSILMGMVKMNTISLSKGITTPKSFLISLYSSMRDLIPEEMFITLVVCILEKDGSIYFSSAGHYPPLIYKFSQNKFEEIKMESLPLGFSFLNISEFADSIKEIKIKIEKGDVFMIYTDGLIDLENEYGEIFGEERIKNIILSSPNGVSNIKKKIIKEMELFKGEREIKDDVSFLIIGKK
ncbi:MAG: SpoIIE family protein phosphatase [candidate division WOR-3 bacterium]